MRGLASFHDITNSLESHFVQPGFFAYLLYSSWRTEFRETIRKEWDYIDVFAGEALHLITMDFRPAVDSDFAKQNSAVLKFLEESKFRIDDLPCLVFTRGTHSNDYFLHRFPKNQDGSITPTMILTDLEYIFSECRVLFDRDENQEYYESNFNTLTQRLRSDKFIDRAGDLIRGPIGRELFAALRTAAGIGFG